MIHGYICYRESTPASREGIKRLTNSEAELETREQKPLHNQISHKECSERRGQFRKQNSNIIYLILLKLYMYFRKLLHIYHTSYFFFFLNKRKGKKKKLRRYISRMENLIQFYSRTGTNSHILIVPSSLPEARNRLPCKVFKKKFEVKYITLY